MPTQEKKLSKKLGRPATGQGHLVGVRLPPDLLAALDRYICEDCPGTSRPEALRRLAAEALLTMGLRAIRAE